MLLRSRELAFSLDESNLRVIHQLARQRSFAIERFTAFIHFAGGLQILLRRVEIRLGLYGVFRHGRRSGGLIRRLRLLIEAFTLLSSSDQIAIFESSQQLSLAHVIAALHEKVLHRRANLRHDVRLAHWIKHRFHGDDSVDRTLLGGGNLDGRSRFCRIPGIVALASGTRDEKERKCQGRENGQLGHFMEYRLTTGQRRAQHDIAANHHRRPSAPDLRLSAHPLPPARLLLRPDSGGQ